MSDNVNITPGTGATVGADLISGVLYQRVKPVWGVDGSQVDTSATNPMPVSIVSGSFSLVSGDDPLTVGGDSDLLVPTIVLSTSPAYAVGDVLGGRLQLTNALGTLRSGILQSVKVRFKGSLTPALDIWIFDSQPVQNTADNAPFAWDATDDGKLLWRVGVENATTAVDTIGHYITMPGATTRKVACILPGSPILKSAGSSDLWLYITTRTAFTAAATSDMRIALGIGRD